MTLARYYTPELFNGKGAGGEALKTLMGRRVQIHNAESKMAVTDTSMPAGSYVFTPGGYPGYWVRDFMFAVEAAPSLYTADEIFWGVEFVRLHQIKNGTTNYTAPYSGASLTFTKGAVPDHIDADGTTYMFPGVPPGEVGDRPALDDHFCFVVLAWQWCEKREWDATALAWLAAVTDGETNLAWLEHAFNAVPYDGTLKLIKQWDSNPGASWGFYDNYRMGGGVLPVSVMAHNAALCLAEMHDRLGNTTEAGTWATKADDLRDGIRAQFIDLATWEQSAHVYYYEDWQTYPTGVGVPQGWTSLFTNGVVEILADPDNANNKVLRVRDTSAAGGCGIGKTFLHPNFIGAWQRVKSRARAAQTNATGVALRLPNAIGIFFGDDGNFKYFTGASFNNLPTTTAYSANTWYEVEARINWGNSTYNIWIDGVDKGNVAFGGAESTIEYVEIVNCSKTGPEQGDYLYDYILFYNTTSDYGTQGYLPCATDELNGKVPDIAGTGYAVWSNILTTAQAEKAGRWLKKLYNQPKGSANGYGNAFNVGAYTPAVAHVPYSHHSRHDSLIFPFRWVTPIGGYGTYQNGGYWYYDLNWVISAIAAADGTLADQITSALILSVNGLATGHPYERVDSDLPVNANYITSSAPIYGAANDYVAPATSGGFPNPFGGGLVR